MNIIEYDGKARFNPGPGLTLRKATSTDVIVDQDNPEPTGVALDDATATALLDAFSEAGDDIEKVKTAILDVLIPDERREGRGV